VGAGLTDLAAGRESEAELLVAMRRHVCGRWHVDRVLTDQVRALDVQSITGGLGRLSSEELQMLDDALAVVLGLHV